MFVRPPLWLGRAYCWPGSARPKRGQKAADLCSGCGIVSLEWHDSGHRGPCTALELQPEASALLAEAVAAQGPELAHITPVRADLRAYREGEGSFDLCACNPPYFTAGFQSSNAARATARHETDCTLEDVCACGFRLLKDGGRLALCHRPERLAEVLAVLRAHRLEPKRLAFVKNRAESAPWLFLVEAQKNRKTGLEDRAGHAHCSRCCNVRKTLRRAVMAGTLYIVATPIGNLEDIAAPRRRQRLATADFIAAEDTRVTMKLLNHLGLKKPMVSYYEHDIQKGEGGYPPDRIEAGESLRPLLATPGMPCVSDPGRGHRAGRAGPGHQRGARARGHRPASRHWPSRGRTPPAGCLRAFCP